MKNILLLMILSVISTTQLFAIDASIGAKIGFSTNPNDWGNSWSNGLYLEVGLLQRFSIVMDGNMHFKSNYYLNDNKDSSDTELYRRTFRSGGDFSFLSKVRFGDNIRGVMAFGPSMQMTKDQKKNRNYDLLGFTALLGFEADLGPGYFFSNITYAGYFNFTSRTANNSITLTYNDYTDSFKVYFGYALRFKNSNRDAKVKPEYLSTPQRGSSGGAMNLSLSI